MAEVSSKVNFNQGAEWQGLFSETFSNSHQFNTVRGYDFNLEDLQDDFLDLDQWLDQNYLTGDSTDLDKEQVSDLAPSLYAAFSGPER